jgi:acetyl-CoA synthetase
MMALSISMPEVAVVGAPDAIKGLVPAAFVTLKAGSAPSSEIRDTVRRQVADVIGKIAIPEHVFFTDALPKTSSGKAMRRLLKEILETGDVGSDTTGLENRSSVEHLKTMVKDALRPR